jgi:hypothetical protein
MSRLLSVQLPDDIQWDADSSESVQFESVSSEAVLSETLFFNSTDWARSHQPAVALMAILVATGGLALAAQGAIAQEVPTPTPTIIYDSVSGSVEVDNNAFIIRTGDFSNDSNIALPSTLPSVAMEGVPLQTRSDIQAPNNVEITADVTYINQSFNRILADEISNATYSIQPESLQLTTQFDVRYRPGDHGYGEGIQATVFNPDGTIKRQESAFVRGDGVQIGPNGEPLPTTNQIGVNYGANDRVELRVLNLREDNAQPNESAIYFSRDGQFIVEDFQNGGDRDFNDGDYFEISQGRGEALTLQEVSEVSVENQVSETSLAPETRQEELVETDIVEIMRTVETSVEESKTWGAVEAPDSAATRLGHATGMVSENDEQLIYNRYASESQIRLGSDGLSISGQLAPLVNNPNAWPTLLSGSVGFNPTVGNNEAGFTAAVGLTQFLNPTHRQATDVLGNVIENPNPNGSRLVEPAGLFSNRRWMGYVPAVESEITSGAQLFSTNGIFELPRDQSILIEAADPQRVGQGNAAYSNNVGGLLIEQADGDISFVPQWTNSGYAQAPIYLEEGEARRVIYALVPQQLGQDLQIGQTYAVENGSSGYQIADGGFTIISADRQPQNFLAEMSEVYAVEDTLPSGNAVTNLFNGRQGIYVETLGGDKIPTVDVGLAAEADARVGNRLFPTNVVVGQEGQAAYAQTTRAMGFYLGGSLTGGIGNQKDTISRTVSTVEQATDEMRTLRTLNTFATPLVQIDSVDLQTTTVTQNTGTALFDINRQGELNNVRFIEGESRVVNSTTVELNRQQNLVRGEEVLASSVTSQTSEQMARLTEADQQTTSETDSYANFSAGQGELAVGGVLNFGNTPWTAAANTFRAELFARDAVFGRSSDGSETGWRAELLFHPFGEVQREAHQYDANGNAVLLYQTEPLRDASGQQVMETLVAVDGSAVEVPVNRFVLDEAGDRIAQTVGTGRARGVGLYLRVEDVLSDSDSALIAGGMQLSF